LKTLDPAVILAQNGVLSMDAGSLSGAEGASRGVDAARSNEREALEAALSASKGKVAGENGAAKRLGLPASTVEFRIRRLGIDKFRYRAR